VVIGSTALERFNALPREQAERELLACCASPLWARELAGRRPYPDIQACVDAAGTVAVSLPWSEVAAALAAHPRIGERLAGDSREAAWSRREQAGVVREDEQTRAALAEANREYEERFGYVFLIFASGRTASEMLAVARDRLANDETTEREVVRVELGKIAQLRLERLFS